MILAHHLVWVRSHLWRPVESYPRDDLAVFDGLRELLGSKQLHHLSAASPQAEVELQGYAPAEPP